MKKNTVIVVACSIIGILVLLLVILWLLTIVNRKYYSYVEVEAKMLEATQKYYKKNPEMLPVNEGKSTLAYKTLEENEFIEPLNKLLKDGDSCSAEVSVYKDSNNYTYIPRLSCSDKYETIELSKHVLNIFEVVTEGSGLYDAGDGSYYFRGKVLNNHVALGSFQSHSKETESILWQIIGIEPDGRIKIRALYSNVKSVWDDRYNEGKTSNTGYNDYEASIIKDTLKKMEENEDFLTGAEKSKLVKANLCVGKRSSKDKTKDGSVECSVMSEDEMLFGLLYPYEYMRASLDENCINMMDPSCQNFNYLAGDGFGIDWTLTANPKNDYEVYTFDGILFDVSNANRQRPLYVTAYLSPYVIFRSGEGTRENPFIIAN